MESKGCLLMKPQDQERIKLIKEIKSNKIIQADALRF
jgi:hypothetical protein